MKTFSLRKEDIERNWYLIDAEGKVLGRLASAIATRLRGKHKETYTPHLDMGDHIIVINADKVNVTGRKPQQKKYYRYSGYPGGLKSQTLENLLQTHPEKVIRRAVWGMLPHNRLGRKMIKKLKIYSTPEHPHLAQKPEELSL